MDRQLDQAQGPAAIAGRPGVLGQAEVAATDVPLAQRARLVPIDVLAAVELAGGVLAFQGQQGAFNAKGLTLAGLGGVLGALGALGVILAFQFGGKPFYVMPLVFGCAPIVNVALSMTLHPPKTALSPWLFAGFGLVAFGAFLVLRFKPA